MTVSDGIPNELSDYHQKDPSCSLPGLPQTLFFSIATPITTSAVWSCPFVLQLVSLYNCCFLILLITPSNGVDRAGQGGKGAFHSHRGKRFLGTRQGGHSHSQALVVLGRKHPSGPMGLNLSSQWETEKKKRQRLRRKALPPSHILMRASFTWLSSLQPRFFSLCSLLHDSTESTRRKLSENTKLAARKCTAIGSPNKTSQIPT